MIVFLPAVYISDNDLTVLNKFSIIDLLCMCGVGGLTLVNQVMRFRALKYSEASRMQPYAFLRPLQQYLTDILIFHTVFADLQLLGIFFLIGIYTVKLVLDLIGIRF